MGRWRDERGLTLPEVMIAVAIITLISSGLVSLLHGVITDADAGVTTQHTTVVVARFMDQVEADADSAIAIFVPPNDVNGISNSDGHELDFFTRDGSKQPYFWAYTFNLATHSIQKYTYVWNTPSSVQAVGQPFVLSSGSSTVGAFSAQGLLASSRASNPMFANYTPVNHTLATGYPGVLAGNNLVQITLTAQANTPTGSELRTTRLIAGTQLSGAQYLSGTFTPPPNPLSVTVNSMTFASQNAGAQTTTALENYYVGTFSSAIGTCTNVVTISQNASVFTVTPNPSLQAPSSCSFIVADQLGQTASVSVTVDFVASSMTVNPTSLLFNSATAASQAFNVSEAHDTAQFTIANPSNCTSGGIASISSVSQAGPNATFTVSPSGGGTCVFTVNDTHGASQTVSVTVYGPLVVSPLSFSFAGPSAPAQTLNMSEIAYNQSFTLSNSTCNGIAALSSANANGPAASATITPNGVGACSYSVSDNHGNAQTVGVTVAATPTPAPCPGGYSGTPPNCVLASTPSPSPSPVSCPNSGNSWLGEGKCYDLWYGMVDCEDDGGWECYTEYDYVPHGSAGYTQLDGLNPITLKTTTTNIPTGTRFCWFDTVNGVNQPVNNSSNGAGFSCAQMGLAEIVPPGPCTGVMVNGVCRTLPIIFPKLPPGEPPPL